MKVVKRGMPTGKSRFWHFVLLLAIPAVVCAKNDLPLAASGPDRETEIGELPLVSNATVREPSPDEGVVRNFLICPSLYLSILF